jgi:hypothetical protein
MPRLDAQITVLHVRTDMTGQQDRAQNVIFLPRLSSCLSRPDSSCDKKSRAASSARHDRIRREGGRKDKEEKPSALNEGKTLSVLPGTDLRDQMFLECASASIHQPVSPSKPAGGCTRQRLSKSIFQSGKATRASSLFQQQWLNQWEVGGAENCTFCAKIANTTLSDPIRFVLQHHPAAKAPLSGEIRARPLRLLKQQGQRRKEKESAAAALALVSVTIAG